MEWLYIAEVPIYTLLDTPYKDIRLAIQNYISPKESSNGRKG